MLEYSLNSDKVVSLFEQQPSEQHEGVAAHGYERILQLLQYMLEGFFVIFHRISRGAGADVPCGDVGAQVPSKLCDVIVAVPSQRLQKCNEALQFLLEALVGLIHACVTCKLRQCFCLSEAPIMTASSRCRPSWMISSLSEATMVRMMRSACETRHDGAPCIQAAFTHSWWICYHVGRVLLRQGHQQLHAAFHVSNAALSDFVCKRMSLIK